ncbi:chitin synthase [Holotrichia oblita]|uniref:Chitin synthase n=1 Tax=Holotrichia oblita TaxID=644536 RepID=A0ACB9T3V3_HOLOL|nr:chitin synthase [Holotrichia oblita]
MYEPFLIDQDLALNRRVDDGNIWNEEEHDEDDFVEDIDEIRAKPSDFATVHDDDRITRIYACATMWHETKEEMMEFLKSIFRMDEDQCARRTVREKLGFNLPDYYEIETNIFFDDAFVRVSQEDPDPQVNEFVKTLVSSMDEAASVVHEVNIRLRPPKKIITPYGGRLVWTLPGKTKLIAHLKDKKKLEQRSAGLKLCTCENTYLLALDGDIDFQPKAVHLLVELMKKNKNLGAACGRIHPLGSGLMYWYQMFEYAVGHWLQKATEHVIGCVLCSPGCFSLFRGKALMDDSIMAKYTTKSAEARHYLFVAAILSGIYSLVMMAVLIGVVLQTTSDGWLAPSSLFFFGMVSGYIITALLHPKETHCLKYALVYYVTIPSMYMLLVIYSVFNMNNVSWGTREVTVVATPQNNPGSPSPTQPKQENKQSNWIIRWCGARSEDNRGAMEFSIATLFRCIWCTHMDAEENDKLNAINQSLKAIQDRLERIEKGQDLDEPDYPQTRRKTGGTIIATGAGMSISRDVTDDISIMRGRSSNSPSIESLVNISENSWLEDEVLQRGEVEFLFNEEEEFWHGVIDKYLHPIDDAKNKERIAQDLKDLRDKMVLAFFMINALFVLVIFLLTLNSDVINVQWPFGYSVNFTYMDDVNMIWIEKEFLQLEPIGIVFLAVFASLILIQFIGMLFHRFQTFTQVVSNTVFSLNLFSTKAEKLTEDEMLEQNPVEIAKQLQKLKGVDDVKENAPEIQPGRRKTVAWLDQRSKKPRETINDLDTAFQRRAGKIIDNKDYTGPIRRVTVKAIQRRQSKMLGIDLQNGRNSRLLDLQPPSARPSRGHHNLGFSSDSSI